MSLFDDPIGWSGQIVKTWWHFAFSGLIYAALVGVVLVSASDNNWRTKVILGGMLVMYQLMYMYAMRKMYLKLTNRPKSEGNESGSSDLLELDGVAPGSSAKGNSFNLKAAFYFASDLVLCALPFAMASYLCNVPFDRVDPGMRYWEPAFYSFLPMVFFFVGAVVFFTRREMRELKERIDGMQSRKE